MAIYKPDLHLSKNERLLIQLLARLLLEHYDSTELSNYSDDFVPLSNEEAFQLVNLIEILLNKSDFTFATHFIDFLVNFSEEENEKNAKEIFLSQRKKRGRKREMNTYRWSEFTVRLGVEDPYNARLRGSSSDIEKMSYDHFLSMERKLFETLKIHPRIREILMLLVANQRQKLTEIQQIDHVPSKKVLTDITDRIKNKNDNTVLKINICAAITLIANYGVLWTTRDWGTTGTLSCMAGAHMTLFQALPKL